MSAKSTLLIDYLRWKWCKNPARVHFLFFRMYQTCVQRLSLQIANTLLIVDLQVMKMF